MRQFLDKDVNLGDWAVVEPYYRELEERAIPSVDALAIWLRDLSELESWLSEILASIERTWSNLRRFTTVIPAGGGSIVLGDILRLALISKGAAVS